MIGLPVLGFVAFIGIGIYCKFFYMPNKENEVFNNSGSNNTDDRDDDFLRVSTVWINCSNYS